MLRLANGRPHALLVGVVAVLALYRLFLPVWAGQFGPDEAALAILAHQVLTGQGSFLIGGEGTRGFPYGPLPELLFGALYSITGYNLGVVALVSSALSLMAAFLAAASVDARRHAIWVLLLGLTSPLAIYFSTAPFWVTPILIPLSAAVLWLARQSILTGSRREFAIGFVLGLSLDVHPLAIPFVMATGLWRLIVVRRALPVGALTCGLLVAIAPYLVGLMRVRDTIALTVTFGGRPFVAPSPVSLIESLLRFWGQHATFRLTPVGPLRTLEDSLAAVTLVVIGVSIVGWLVYMRRTRSTLRADSLMTLAALCAVVYLPFAYATSADRADLGQSMWWLAPVVLTTCAFGLLGSSKGAWVLAALIGFNVLTTGVEYWTRVWHGTTAEATAEAGQGPSWWMQLQAMMEICSAVEQQIASGEHPPVVVETDCKWCDSGIPVLAALKSPQCAQDTRLVPASEAPRRLNLGADASHTYLTLGWVNQAGGDAGAPTPPAGLVLRLGAESIRDLPAGAPVGRWPDLSGEGNDALQVDPARQPLYVPTALNGQPAVQFNGTSDVLITPPVLLAQDHTIVVVARVRRTQNGTTDMLWSYAADEAAPTLVEVGVYRDQGALRALRTRYEGIDTYNGKQSPLLEQPFIIVQRRVAGRVRTSINGGEDVFLPDLTVDFPGPRRFRMGLHSDSGQYLDGSVAEIRVYNSALGDDEVADIVGDLARTYAIAVQR